jgi:hypothetical protein
MNVEVIKIEECDKGDASRDRLAIGGAAATHNFDFEANHRHQPSFHHTQDARSTPVALPRAIFSPEVRQERRHAPQAELPGLKRTQFETVYTGPAFGHFGR